MRELSDSELMDLYARGSEPAFGELFRRYEGRAFGYFLRRVGSESRARDLYQELFLRLHRFRSTYDPARPFEPWFFHVAHSVIVDEWRQQQRRAEVAVSEGDLRSQESDAERVVAARQEAERVLESLSPEHARILVDAKVRGLEHREIAAALSKSVDAVKQTASRSLRRLRQAHALGH
ncbi:MAG TPA: RNA polymerase sigma factor [Longimicrobiaceae bacterium]|nr:RNA polymerase sigma factor [Longimicrobiaceae bacterium]